MEVTLRLKQDHYNEKEIPSEDGQSIIVKRKLIKRNVITTINIDTNDIILIGDLLNNKGNVVKNYCRIHLKEVGPIVVNHSKEQISQLKQHKFNQIGFKRR